MSHNTLSCACFCLRISAAQLHMHPKQTIVRYKADRLDGPVSAYHEIGPIVSDHMPLPN